jgi:hypothetical protein
MVLPLGHRKIRAGTGSYGNGRIDFADVVWLANHL